MIDPFKKQLQEIGFGSKRNDVDQDWLLVRCYPSIPLPDTDCYRHKSGAQRDRTQKG